MVMDAPQLWCRDVADPVGHCRFPAPIYGKTRMAGFYDTGNISRYGHDLGGLSGKLNGTAKLA